MVSRLVEHIFSWTILVWCSLSPCQLQCYSDVHAEDILVADMYGTNSLHTQYGTPLAIARSQGHGRIVQLLREANRQRYTYYGQVPH